MSLTLLQVYLAAIRGHVPSEIVKTFAAFLDFCYIARRNALNTHDLSALEAALARFHRHRQIFITLGIHSTLSLPRQHSLSHYARSIRLFGSPNGLCSSITESKHIKAVKEPWRRSSRNKPLPQMLQTLSRLSKLEAAHHMFTKRGMMMGTLTSYTAMLARGEYPTSVEEEEGEESGPEEDVDDEVELGPSSGPKVRTSIALAVKPGA